MLARARRRLPGGAVALYEVLDAAAHAPVSLPAMIRVFLADDHAVLRRGLQLMLESTGQMTVVGTAGDGHEVLDAPALATCDVLILDLNLPRLSGSEVLRRLRERRPELPV